LAPDPLPRGARVVEITSDGNGKTWIQNGEIGIEHDCLLEMVGLLCVNQMAWIGCVGSGMSIIIHATLMIVGI